MNRLLLSSIISLSCLPLFAQSNLVNNGAIIKVSSGTDVRVKQGNIRNDASGNIDNLGNIYLDGTFNQISSATYNGSVASWLWFEGTTNQNITGDATLNIARVRVDNGAKLILGNHLNVGFDADLTLNGNIELGAFNMVMAPGATINNYDAANFIITNSTGVLQQQVGPIATFFPVGNATYNPLTLTNTGVVDNFLLRVDNQVLDFGTIGNPETANIVNRTWHLSEETAGGSDATITVQWEQGQELTGFDRNNCAVSHWNGSAWDHSMTYNAATNVGGTNWIQTRIGQTTFSPFAVEDLNMDLPVDWLSFEATRMSIDKVNLDWATASELNCAGYEVERMLDGETGFTFLGYVDGNGTTLNTSYYEYIDNNGFEGVSYYRIKQVDFDGSSEYTEIKAVTGVAIGNFDFDVFPNPTEDHINIRVSSEIVDEVIIQVLDSKGAVVVENTLATKTGNLIQLKDIRHLVDGVYMIQLTTDRGITFAKKFVKR